MPTPRSSALRGESMLAGFPSMRISPESAGCAPARIFISVDFPAPFSPTSACTSPARKSSVTPSSARTPGKLFPMSRISRRGAVSRAVLLRVRRRISSGRNLDARRDLLSVEIIVNGVHRQLADLIGMLNGVAIHLPALDRCSGFRRCIVSDDGDIRESGGTNRRDRSERRVVVDPEDAFKIAMRLQNVAHIGVRLRART